jgi:hypothetical protein
MKLCGIEKVYHLSMVEVVCSFLKLTLDIYPIKISMQQESLCVKNNVVEAKTVFNTLSSYFTNTKKTRKQFCCKAINILLTFTKLENFNIF